MDVQALHDKYPDDYEQINELRLAAFNQEQLVALSTSPAGSYLITYLGTLIDGSNKELTADKKMTEHERDLVLERRRIYTLVQSLFTYSSQRLEGIENIKSARLQ